MHHRQRFSLLLCLVISLSTAAQDEGGMRVGYGFNIGVNHSLLSLQTVGVMEDGASLRTVNKPGLDLGLQAQLDLGESIRLRPGVNLAFVNHSLQYTYPDGASAEFQMPNAYLEVPFHFMFAHQNLTQNIAVLFGVRYSRALEPELNQVLGLQERFTSFEVGLGKDFDFGHFHVSPEITYTFGTQNLYRFSTTPELDGVVDQLFLDRVAFRLVFHG